MPASVLYYNLVCRKPHYTGFRSARGISFGEAKNERAFVAAVELKKAGTWRIVRDSASGDPIAGAKPTEYLMIYLVTSRGAHLCINKEEPTTNDVAFFKSLVEGKGTVSGHLCPLERQHGPLE